jgi:hypothetical protein
MTRARRTVIALAVAVVLAACAPSFESIYDSDSTIVSGGTGAQPTNSTWTVGSTTHTTRNYSTATWSVSCSTKDNFGLRVTAGGTDPDIGAYGGLVRAAQPPGSYTWDQYHYCPGVKSETDGVVLDRWHISGMGDGFVDRDNGTIGTDSRLSRSWVFQSGDDCVQSDSGADGVTIQDNLLQECWAGISARQGSGNYSSATMLVYDNVVTVADHTACYSPGSKPCPSHAGWLKWYSPASDATRIILRNNVFVAHTYPRNSGDLAENAPLSAFNDSSTPANESCDGNVLVMLSSNPADLADFQTDVATWAAAGCTNTRVYTPTTSPTAASVWLTAVGNWHQAHDSLIQQPGTP